MNKCIDSGIKEMLPDLLHRALRADAMARVEAHIATCEECRAELNVLRAVKSAAVFEPSIDVDQVVRRIPPYRAIVPAVELPARPRLVSWLVAASLAVAVVGVGSVLVTRQNATNNSTSVGATKPSATAPAQPTPAASKTPDAGTVSGTVAATRQPHTHALALAADVDGLSDGNLVQLMNDMNRFDALPATESEPVIAVDSGY
jgi:predicted anti-sigma-YlaC factor YlaD